MRRRYDDGKPKRRTEVANDQGPTALSLSGHLFNPQYLLTSDDFTSFRLWMFSNFKFSYWAARTRKIYYFRHTENRSAPTVKYIAIDH
jgi:hypothetical protein